MQYSKWLAVLFTISLLVACLFPWVTIESNNMVLTGFHTEGTNFGKPGIFHYFLSFIFIIFVLVNRVWSLRTAFFVSVFNVAWALRNYITISTCYGGICPDKKPALYIVLIASILTSVASLFVSAPAMPPAPEEHGKKQPD